MAQSTNDKLLAGIYRELKAVKETMSQMHGTLAHMQQQIYDIPARIDSRQPRTAVPAVKSDRVRAFMGWCSNCHKPSIRTFKGTCMDPCDPCQYCGCHGRLTQAKVWDVP